MLYIVDYLEFCLSCFCEVNVLWFEVLLFLFFSLVIDKNLCYKIWYVYDVVVRSSWKINDWSVNWLYFFMY